MFKVKTKKVKKEATQYQDTELRIAFWVNQSETAASSHAVGLTEDQVNFLKQLEPGDKLVLFFEEKEKDNQPDFILKKSKK